MTTLATAVESLHIEMDEGDYIVSDAERAQMERELDLLEKVVEKFPHADLYVTIQKQARTGDVEVRTSLLLPGKTLFTGDQDVTAAPAFGRCARKLVQKLRGYERELDNEDAKRKYEKGTRQEVEPLYPHDPEAVAAAVRNRDYNAFREALYMYEEPIRKRAGRWVQRYPAVEAEVGRGLRMADVVEEVFLNAFERYEHRPDEELMGEWLESLIDPSVKMLLQHPDEELTNISFARTLRRTVDEERADSPPK